LIAGLQIFQQVVFIICTPQLTRIYQELFYSGIFFLFALADALLHLLLIVLCQYVGRILLVAKDGLARPLFIETYLPLVEGRRLLETVEPIVMSFVLHLRWPRKLEAKVNETFTAHSDQITASLTV
jgi:hypothetical protein